MTARWLTTSGGPVTEVLYTLNGVPACARLPGRWSAEAALASIEELRARANAKESGR